MEQNRYETSIQVEEMRDIAGQVVEAVALFLDRDAMELPPIHNELDCDALNGIFKNSNGFHAVEFTYLEVDCRLKQNGDLTLLKWDEAP